MFGNIIETIVSMIIIYYMPNMSFKLMDLVMDEINSWTK